MANSVAAAAESTKTKGGGSESSAARIPAARSGRATKNKVMEMVWRGTVAPARDGRRDQRGREALRKALIRRADGRDRRRRDAGAPLT